eukprot:Lithocolla_globosa_v1_NODE_6_length_11976_cov_15.425432.p17 type:complete len:119 gc:universal NODE_6_length_11976_cov_15.425432:2925-3281(+)
MNGFRVTTKESTVSRLRFKGKQYCPSFSSSRSLMSLLANNAATPKFGRLTFLVASVSSTLREQFSTRRPPRAKALCQACSNKSPPATLNPARDAVLAHVCIVQFPDIATCTARYCRTT